MTKPSPAQFMKGTWQLYRALRHVDYWNKHGGHCELVEYEAPCADPRCQGALFRARANKQSWKSRNVNRRCKKHSAPGRMVDDGKPPTPVSKLPLLHRPEAKRTAARRPARTKVRKAAANAQSRRAEGRIVSRGTDTVLVLTGAAPCPSYLD